MRMLVERYEATVRGVLYWLVEDIENREEAVVDVFLSLMDSDEAFSPVSGLSVWLTRRAVELGENWRRTHAAERSRHAQALREKGRVGKPRPQDVIAALAELPTDFFVPLMLRYLEGRSMGEIAEVTRKGEKQLWSVLHEALEAVDHTIRGVSRPHGRKGASACDRVGLLMLLEDELPARDRRRFAEHAERCNECRSHEWRLSTLLAFLTTIANMKQRQQAPDGAWGRIVSRRGGLAWRRASSMLRRGAVGIAAMAVVAVVAVAALMAANRLDQRRADESPLVPIEQADVAAPTVVEDTTTAVESSVPLTLSHEQEVAAVVPEEPKTEDAWLPLPEFAGNAGQPGSAGPRPLDALPIGPPRPSTREADARPTEPTPPTAPVAPQQPTAPTTGGAQVAGTTGQPRAAGWSRAGRGAGQAPPSPAAHAAPPEGGSRSPRPVVPRPTVPRPPIAHPALPGALGGSGQGGTQPSGATPSGGGELGTLAGVLSRLAGDQ